MTDDVTLCNACKALAVTWNDEAGSDVCQQCGTIYPSMNNLQTLRAEEFEGHSLLQNMVLRVPSSGHVLGGQGDRLHQNLRNYSQIITQLCEALGFSDAQRAILLFQEALRRGSFRWGRATKLVAAISVAIALTESKRAEAIPQISVLIQENIHTLIRTWCTVVKLLDVDLHPTDPFLLISTLCTHLEELLQPPSLLPHVLINRIRSRKRPEDVWRVEAEKIAHFFSRIGAFIDVPGGPTACAILILAIESETSSPLPPSALGTVQRALGERIGLQASAINDRRKAMMVIFAEWAAYVPWILIPSKGDGDILSGPRLLAITRAIKDVLNFQNEILAVRGIAHSNPSVYRVEEIQEDSGTSPMLHLDETVSSSKYKRRRPLRAEQAQHVMSQMLDPTFNKAAKWNKTITKEEIHEYLSRIELQVLYGLEKMPTRLDALLLERGGEHNIADEELFGPGEIESYQNPPELARYLLESNPDWNRPPKLARTRQKRSKADQTLQLKEVNYEYNTDESMDEEDDTDNEGSHTLASFGLLADYDGSDYDTLRFFGNNHENE